MHKLCNSDETQFIDLRFTFEEFYFQCNKKFKNTSIYDSILCTTHLSFTNGVKPMYVVTYVGHSNNQHGNIISNKILIYSVLPNQVQIHYKFCDFKHLADHA